MVNSKVSRQWFVERYAIKAVRDHGGGDELERISFNVGRRTHAAPCGLGIDTLRGRESRLSSGDMDMTVSDEGLSSSASHSVPVGLFEREAV